MDTQLEWRCRSLFPSSLGVFQSFSAELSRIQALGTYRLIDHEFRWTSVVGRVSNLLPSPVESVVLNLHNSHHWTRLHPEFRGVPPWDAETDLYVEREDPMGNVVVKLSGDDNRHETMVIDRTVDFEVREHYLFATRKLVRIDIMRYLSSFEFHGLKHRFSTWCGFLSDGNLSISNWNVSVGRRGALRVWCSLSRI